MGFNPWPEGPCPKGAGGLSPGFQPWEPPPERRALKGRQIQRTNNAKVESKLYTSQLRTLVFALQQAHLVSLSPFHGELVILRVPRVETLG